MVGSCQWYESRTTEKACETFLKLVFMSTTTATFSAVGFYSYVYVLTILFKSVIIYEKHFLLITLQIKTLTHRKVR